MGVLGRMGTTGRLRAHWPDREWVLASNFYTTNDIWISQVLCNDLTCRVVVFYAGFCRFDSRLIFGFVFIETASAQPWRRWRWRWRRGRLYGKRHINDGSSLGCFEIKFADKNKILKPTRRRRLRRRRRRRNKYVIITSHKFRSKLYVLMMYDEPNKDPIFALNGLQINHLLSKRVNIMHCNRKSRYEGCRKCLPSCGPRFESQVQLQCFFQFM